MSPDLISLAVSKAEAELLDDIAEIGYGELYGVEAIGGSLEGEVGSLRRISPRAVAFLKALRRGERFDKVIIHDGEPVMAESEGTTRSGRGCLAKTKF
jgi:hypothetical protein